MSHCPGLSDSKPLFALADGPDPKAQVRVRLPGELLDAWKADRAEREQLKIEGKQVSNYEFRMLPKCFVVVDLCIFFVIV